MRNKINIKSLVFGAVLGAIVMFSVGAASEHADSKPWEYKTVTLNNSPSPDAKLNELGQDGWSVVGFSRNEGGSNTSTFVLKRQKER